MKWEVAVGLQVLPAVLTMVAVLLIVGTGDVLFSHSSYPILAGIELQARGLGSGLGLLTPEPP